MKDDVVREAYKWLGTPYHHHARVQGSGVDCAQFVIAVYEDCGILKKGEIRTGYYSPEWHLHRSEEIYLNWIKRYCVKVSVCAALPGDIAVFQYGRCVSHAGIVTNWPYIIHAYIGVGVCETLIWDAMLCDKRGNSRLKGLYRPVEWR